MPRAPLALLGSRDLTISLCYATVARCSLWPLGPTPPPPVVLVPPGPKAQGSEVNGS